MGGEALLRRLPSYVKRKVSSEHVLALRIGAQNLQIENLPVHYARSIPNPVACTLVVSRTLKKTSFGVLVDNPDMVI